MDSLLNKKGHCIGTGSFMSLASLYTTFRTVNRNLGGCGPASARAPSRFIFPSSLLSPSSLLFLLRFFCVNNRNLGAWAWLIDFLVYSHYLPFTSPYSAHTETHACLYRSHHPVVQPEHCQSFHLKHFSFLSSLLFLPSLSLLHSLPHGRALQ